MDTTKCLIQFLFALTVCTPHLANAQDSGPEDAPDAQATTSPEDRTGTEQFRMDDSTLIIKSDGSEERLQTPCKGAEIARLGERVVLSCGRRGVLRIERDSSGRYRKAGYQTFDGEVTGLIVANNRVWATVQQVAARPLEHEAVATEPVQREPSPEPQTPEEPAPPEPATEGAQPTDDPKPAETADPVPTTPEDRQHKAEVLGVQSGAVIVGLGRNHGLERDDHVELFRESQVDLGSGETSTRIDTVAIGRVVAVSPNRSRVELGLGERVDSSTKARPTGAPLTSYPTAPPRIGDLWEASFALRPFLALRTVGAGTISSARLVYRFEGPFAVHLNALPLSVGLAREGNVSALGGDLALAYDARVFSLGLGIGATQIGFESLAGIELDESGGLTVTQFGRIGARDGLSLRLHNAFVVANREFFYAGTDATIQIPIDWVVSNSWLVLHGGGHVGGEFVGEAGLRVLVRGNGDRGSLFVTPTVGGGVVTNERAIPNCTSDFESDCIETISYGGPLIGVELEWRF